MSSKGRKEKKSEKVKNLCIFCFQTNSESIKLGKMIKFNEIFVHYYCLLLSSGLSQNGRDNEGIYGFLVEDIRKELRRGEKLKCHYCKSTGATIGCSVKTCKISFHLPCGLDNNSMHHFFKNFDSYCFRHRPKQEFTASDETNDTCPACYLKVDFDEGINVLATPCCAKLVHRLCLQKQAINAGYFFKCPLCNNGGEFKKVMIDFGINVPKQDASWEREDNAFGELYRRHSVCDQNPCLCDRGREFTDGRNWQLLICNACGSKGTHWTCIGLTEWIERWICDVCEVAETKIKKALEAKNKVQNDNKDNENSDDDIEVIQTLCTSSLTTSRRLLNGNGIRRKTFPFAMNSNESEISITDEIPPKRMRRQSNRRRVVEKKDVEIQCNLVDVNDLIDSEPIDDMEGYVFKKSDNHSKVVSNPEVIDLIESDDDCVLID